MTSPSLKISHRINFVFERAEPSADIFDLAENLEKVLAEGEVEHGIGAFGSLRHSIRQDPSEKQNVSIIVSFDYSLDALKIPTSFDENREFWTDTTFWKGFKCLCVSMMAPIGLLWTFNFRYDKQPDPAYVKAFEKFGPCTISKTTTGSVLVKFDDVAHAKVAVEALNNTIIDKTRSPILVDYATKSLRVLNRKKNNEPKFFIRVPEKKLEVGEIQLETQRSSPVDYRALPPVAIKSADIREPPRRDVERRGYNDTRNIDNSGRNNSSSNNNYNYNHNYNNGYHDVNLSFRESSMAPSRDSSGGSNGSGGGYRSSGEFRDWRERSPRMAAAARRDERDDLTRSRNDLRRVSRSPKRSPANFSNNNNSSSSSSTIMPIISLSSTTVEVANWIRFLKINMDVKASMIDLVDQERYNGARFCRRINSVESLEREFGVSIPLCDLKEIRTALKSCVFQ